MVDLFVLCVDRDGRVERRIVLDGLEKTFGKILMAVNAWEEIEAWVLAGVELPKSWSWKEVRACVNVKEEYFSRYVGHRGLSGSQGRGRKALGIEAARRVKVIRRKCREDFDHLALRLGQSTSTVA